MLLAGCANPGTPGGDNRATTVGTGAAVGAVLGAVIGGLAGGRRGALAGGLAGGALGAGLGYGVARGNEAAALNEQQINQRAQLARDQSAAYVADSQATFREISALQREVDTLNGQLRRGRISENQYRARLATVQQRSDAIAQRTQGGANAIAGLRKDADAARAAGRDTRALDDALAQWSDANQREQAALDEVQRAIATGRG